MTDKEQLRQYIWRHLRETKAARFPFPLEHRIPNFAHAEAAAQRLTREPFYRRAHVLKCNPDSPQRPLRERALRDGKVVYMAVPRLRHERCFLRLDPRRLDPTDYRKAATISGAAALGTPVDPWQMPHIDLVVAGSVAVRVDGARVGKGGGFSDVEFAIAAELGLVDADTVVATTVHDAQLVDETWPVEPYDIPLDRIVTPTRTIACEGRHERPRGVLWHRLSDGMRRGVPVLARLGRAPTRRQG